MRIFCNQFLSCRIFLCRIQCSLSMHFPTSPARLAVRGRITSFLDEPNDNNGDGGNAAINDNSNSTRNQYDTNFNSSTFDNKSSNFILKIWENIARLAQVESIFSQAGSLGWWMGVPMGHTTSSTSCENPYSTQDHSWWTTVFSQIHNRKISKILFQQVNYFPVSVEATVPYID